MPFRRMSRLPPHHTECSVLIFPKEESLQLNESMLFANVTTLPGRPRGLRSLYWGPFPILLPEGGVDELGESVSR